MARAYIHSFCYYSQHYKSSQFEVYELTTAESMIDTIKPLRPIKKSINLKNSKNEFRVSFLTNLALFSSLLSLIFSMPEAFAATQYELGIKAYQARRYGEAASYFRNAIAKEGGTADAWLYLGHSFYAAGDRARAEQTYKTLQANTNKYSPQSITAGRSLRLIQLTSVTNFGRAAINPGGSLNPLATGASGGQSGKSGGQITVQTPQFGHPEVSSAAVTTVIAAFEALPPNIKQLLTSGNVQIVVTPTMIDKFPSGAYQARLGYGGATDKSCDGLCNGKLIVIAERKINERTNEVGPPRSPDTIQETFLHESGHAIDNCLNGYSQSAEFKTAYTADVSKMSDDDKSKLSYFLQKNGQGQAETFAELASSLLGNHRWAAGAMVENCPASMKCVREKLGL